VRIGSIGIDSGQLILGDPCHVDGKPIDEARAGMLGDKHALAIPLTNVADAAIIVSTGYGDGIYPVYAQIHDGRVMRVVVDFNLETRQ